MIESDNELLDFLKWCERARRFITTMKLSREEYEQIHWALIARRQLLWEISPRPAELEIVQNLLVNFDVASALSEELNHEIR